MKKAVLIGIILFFFSGNLVWGQVGETQRTKADVIIYGGTSAAITTAVQVVRMGKTCVIISPDKHLGGLSSSGLGYTDTGNKSVIGGIAREFYQGIYSYYADASTWKWQEKDSYGNVGQGTPAIDGDKRTMWIFEPHIAEKVFEDFIVENNIKVYREQFLDRQNGVEKSDGAIVSITTEAGLRAYGKIFIDATYEGDLMAAAGVDYSVGRESCSTYQEQWNGVQVGTLHHSHHFGTMEISPYKIPGDPTSGVLAGVSTEDPGKYCEADDRIQAYCYRLCMTKVKENQVPFKKPDDYDPSQYELLARVYEKGWDETFNKFDPIPNLKTDTNNHGPFSMDYIGMNYEYPEADYQRRKEIVEAHKNYQMGLLYFLSNSPRIPKTVQNRFKEWGLAKDEFTDNDHWPYQLYIREARRMIGEYVMTENEVLGKKPVPQPIAMGSYTMDSHNVQRYITSQGYVQNEGDIGVHAEEPYQIALGTILPKAEECKNLIVPVAVSSSHIAFGSIRMEPVFMILGQSAGTVAVLAIQDKKNMVQKVPYDRIKAQLVKDGQVLEYNEN